MSSKVDLALEAVGAFSKYQLIVILITGFNSLITAPHFLVIVFHSTTPAFRCSLPDWSEDTYGVINQQHNESIQQWIPVSDGGELDSCHIYSSNSTSQTEECSQYVFDISKTRGNSLNMQFGMVCSDKIVATTIKVVFTVGLVVGAGLTGIIADRIGRKPTLVVALFLGGAASLVSTYSVDIIMFAVLRFVIGACFVGVLLLNNVIPTECVGPSRRTHAVTLRFFFWPVGTMLTSLLAYYSRDWNWFQLVASVPAFVCAAATLFFLDETPHYLMSKGKHKELSRIFRRIARINGRESPDHIIQELKEDEQAAISERFLEIIKAPVLLKRFITFLYLWLIAGMGFYGLNFNVANLTGNVYINNVISGAAELPTGVLVYFTHRIGRKSVFIASLFSGSVALISSAVMVVYLDMSVEGNSAAQIAVSMLGKLATSTVFYLNYYWSAEMFPSTLRTTMVGLCSLFARVGTILSPIIADLYQQVDTVFGVGLGPLIFGITMFIGGLLAFYLPETSQKRVPETIKESNVFPTKDARKSEQDDQPDTKSELYGERFSQL